MVILLVPTKRRGEVRRRIFEGVEREREREEFVKNGRNQFYSEED